MWRVFGILFGLILPVLGPISAPAQTPQLRIIVLGDMPYKNTRKTRLRYGALIARINRLSPDLVIHLGDTKSGGAPCTDRILRTRRKDLDAFHPPTLYTPGDNEWTDCHRKKAGGYDPQERLGFLRRIYFDQPTQSFGQNPVRVESQTAQGYPENVRLRMGRVMVITAHVVGSNNNASRDTAGTKEFRARQAATTRWLDASFALAQDTDHIVVAIHANMFTDSGFVPKFESFIGNSGFGTFAIRLAKLARRYGKPVLLVHGDTHNFRISQPFLSRAPNLTVLETFGHPEINATQITFQPPGGVSYRIRPVLPTATGNGPGK